MLARYAAPALCPHARPLSPPRCSLASFGIEGLYVPARISTAVGRKYFLHFAGGRVLFSAFRLIVVVSQTYCTGDLHSVRAFFQQFFPPSASQNSLVPAHTFLIFILTFSLFHFFLFTPAAIFELFCFHFSFSIRLTARFLSARRAFSAPPSRIPEWRTSLHLGSSVPSVASWRSRAIFSSPLVGAVAGVLLCRQASVPSGRFFSVLFAFSYFFWVSGCFGGEASCPPDSVSRERWSGARGRWTRRMVARVVVRYAGSVEPRGYASLPTC